MKKYNSWPLGRLPKEMQRQEPFLIREHGYTWDDPREIVTMFENKVVKFTGAKYAVATDCCTHAIHLCLEYYMRHINETCGVITIPRRTYISTPLVIEQAGYKVEFADIEWYGKYKLVPTNIWDAAVVWNSQMYDRPGSLMCLSFQIKKAVPIGRGGMVLTDDKGAAEWIRLASYDGRDLNTPYDSEEHMKIKGWHYYMTPEDAARGILLMDMAEEKGNYMGWNNYPDVEQMLKNIK